MGSTELLVPESEQSKMITENAAFKVGETVIEVLAKQQSGEQTTVEYDIADVFKASVTRRPDGQTTPDE